MKLYGGVEVRLASRPGRFTLEERAPGIHWRGVGVGCRSGLDSLK
jgi:hypothetical protein